MSVGRVLSVSGQIWTNFYGDAEQQPTGLCRAQRHSLFSLRCHEVSRDRHGHTCMKYETCGWRCDKKASDPLFEPISFHVARNLCTCSRIRYISRKGNLDIHISSSSGLHIRIPGSYLFPFLYSKIRESFMIDPNLVNLLTIKPSDNDDFKLIRYDEVLENGRCPFSKWAYSGNVDVLSRGPGRNFTTLERSR